MADETLNMTGGVFDMTALKRASSKFDRSKIRSNLIDKVAETYGAFMPSRFLPVKFIDVSAEQGVVLPYCTIVSAIPVASSKDTTSRIGEMTEFGIDASGQIVVGQNVNGDPISVRADDPFLNYPEEMYGLLTIANGGNAVLGSEEPYTAYDVTTGKVAPDGTLVEAADPSLGRAANRPSGIVIYDVWEDIKGRNLNYNQPTAERATIMLRGRIKVPFVKRTLVDAYNAAYKAVANLFPFVVYEDGMLNGYLQSDKFGKFVKLDPATGDMNQKVGKLLLTDSRSPKTMLGRVDTYPGSQTAGTDTAGLSQMLFVFVSEVLKANSLPYDRKSVLDAVQAGDFGMAYVSINID